MKARLENGVVKVYNRIPNKFSSEIGTVLGGGANLTDEQLSAHGFKDVIKPNFDDRIEELTDIYLSGDIYTYDVIEKPIKETLAELKSEKISQLKSMIGGILSQTDWYVIRQADAGTDIPQDIKDDRAALRTASDLIEAEINALSTKKAVVLFNIEL